jgi:hypothetical protein
MSVRMLTGLLKNLPSGGPPGIKLDPTSIGAEGSKDPVVFSGPGIAPGSEGVV